MTWRKPAARDSYLVWCQRSALGGYCLGHQDCREADRMRRLRPKPVPRKSRKRTSC